MEQALAVMPTEGISPMLSPREQVEKASEMAKVLQEVVRQARLSRKFGGEKEHLYFEAWQTIGQFFNCSPVTEWTRAVKDGDKIVGYEARVQVVNSDGRVIAAAESMCMRDEPNWRTKPLYAMRSMAQTRTAGKALRSVFAWVAVLAGYSGTPAEEMVEEEVREESKSAPKKRMNKTEFDFVVSCQKAKNQLGQELYYEVLGLHGFEHCTDVGDDAKEAVLEDLRKAWKSIQNGTN